MSYSSRNYSDRAATRNGSRGAAGDDNGYPRARPPPRPPAGFKVSARAPRAEPRHDAPSMRPGRARDDEYGDSNYEDQRRPSGRSRAQAPEPSSARRPPPPMRHAEPEYDESYEDNHPSAQVEKAGPNPASSAWGWDAWKKTVWGEEKQGAPDDAHPSDEPLPDAQAEDQPDTIWTRIAIVGATIKTKIVGPEDDGYASDATNYDGDSHLIRIMKEFYVEKAQSQRDLPTWLFSTDEVRSADVGARFNDEGPSQFTETPSARSRGPESRKPGALSDIYDSIPEDRGNQRGYPKSPRNTNSFDSGYASGPSPPVNRRKLARDEEDSRPPQQVSRNRLARPSGPPARGYEDTAARRPRGRQDDNDGMYDDGPAYGAPRNYRGGEADYGDQRGGDPYSRRGPAARAQPMRGYRER